MNSPQPELVCPTCHKPVPASAEVCPDDGTPMFEKTYTGDLLIGARLGDYQVVERIGAGGMGIVYRALQPEIGKQVAIKVLRPALADPTGGVDHLLTEARAVNAVGHRGIVDIFGFGEAPDGRHYVVMELLDGEPLDRLIAPKRPLPLSEAIPLLDGILAPLGAAHAAGITHGDLKPNNIFVLRHEDGSRAVKLLDFGLARSRPPGSPHSNTRVDGLMGTPRYMAPEQASGTAPNPSTDLYAFGVIAFELLTATHPFQAETAAECIRLHLEKVPPAPSSLVPELPKAVDELVLELLAKDPGARPASAEAVRKRLHATGAHPTPAPRRDSEARVPEPPRKSLAVLPAKLPRDTVVARALPSAPVRRGRLKGPLLVALGSVAAAVAIFFLTLHLLGRKPSAQLAEIAPAPRLISPAPEPPRARKTAPRPRGETRHAAARRHSLAPSVETIRAQAVLFQRDFAARPDWWRYGHPRAIRRLQKILAHLERNPNEAGRSLAAFRLEKWQRHFLPR